LSSTDVSRSIAQDLIEAELQNLGTQQPLREAPIQADAPAESDSMLPLIPSLGHDTLGEDKKEENCPARDCHSTNFHNPYSDNDDSLLEPKEGDVQENPNIEEGANLLIRLKLADAPATDKTKDKGKKPKRKHSSLPLQPPLSPETLEKPKSRRSASPRRAAALAKEAAFTQQEATTRLKKPPVCPKEEAAARLKIPPLYPKAVTAATVPLMMVVVTTMTVLRAPTKIAPSL
jgi:hypothetical protein